MDPIFKKLNFKEQDSILVLQAPESFEPNLSAMQGLTHCHRELDEIEQLTFCLAFVTRQEEINDLLPKLAPKLVGDALLWMAYPKKSSKKI